MKALVLSDIHGASPNIRKIIHDTHPDLLILPGDIPSSIHFRTLFTVYLKGGRRDQYIEKIYHNDFITPFQIKSARKVLEQLLSYEVPIVFIHGNTETIGTRSWMKNYAEQHPDLMYIADSFQKFDGYNFIGYGWVASENSHDRLLSPGEISKDEDMKRVSRLRSLIRENSTNILISHSPPYNTPLDFLPHKHIHAGSVALRNFVNNNPIDWIICGHLHESIGYVIDNRWKGVNAGAIVEGKGCLINFENNEVTWYNKLSRPNFLSLIYRHRTKLKYDKA